MVSTIIMETTSRIVYIFGDQNPIYAELHRALAPYGVELKDSQTMQELASLISVSVPNLIIIDTEMHNGEGMQILEMLRTSENQQLQKIPIVISSKTGDLMEISKCLNFGVQDYFVKSTFDLSSALEKIKKQLWIGGAPQIAQTVTKNQMGETKVLIVEDDKFLRDLATQKLIKEGLQVYSAMDGEQGALLAEQHLPSIILLDILLPGIDGYEVLRRIRANPALLKTHVAMLSNFGQREDIERALKAGANQFLIKANFTLDEIVQEVKKIIASAS